MIQANQIKPTDLRIGNLIYSKEHNRNCAVILISARSIGVDIKAVNSLDVEDYSPIPLTEEWLIRFGFEYHHDTPHPNRVFRKNWDEGFFELEEIITFFYGGNLTSVEVKYVHQLQNLYFALTQTELTLKDNA